jgi:hypothetical protein
MLEKSLFAIFEFGVSMKGMEQISKHEKCANCESPLHLKQSECPYCGVIYAKVLTEEEKSSRDLMPDPVLKLEWQGVIEDYTNLPRHEFYLQKSLERKNLAFASQSYRKILEGNPQDDVALAMQKKIIDVAMAQMWSSQVPTPEVRSKKFKYLLFMIIMAAVVAFSFQNYVYRMLGK